MVASAELVPQWAVAMTVSPLSPGVKTAVRPLPTTVSPPETDHQTCSPAFTGVICAVRVMVPVPAAMSFVLAVTVVTFTTLMDRTSVFVPVTNSFSATSLTVRSKVPAVSADNIMPNE